MYSGNNDRDQRDSFKKVPILRPQEIQKLDQLKRYVNNPDMMQQNKGRESYRPSKGSFRPSRSLKNQHKPQNLSNNQAHLYETDNSGLTKQLTFRTFDQSDGQKRRLNQKLIVQDEQMGLIQRCCPIFRGQQTNTQQSPFKAARHPDYRR